jgi:hypothetical protein
LSNTALKSTGLGATVGLGASVGLGATVGALVGAGVAAGAQLLRITATSSNPASRADIYLFDFMFFSPQCFILARVCPAIDY